MSNIFYTLLGQLRPKKRYIVSKRTTEPVKAQPETEQKQKLSEDTEHGMERIRTKVEKEDFLLKPSNTSCLVL